MAKRKHRKEKEEKRLISNPAPLVGVILIIVSLLGILPTPLGIVGEVVASFAMFLVGTGCLFDCHRFDRVGPLKLCNGE